MSVLDEICAKKRVHVEARKGHDPLTEVKARARDASPPLGFLDSLRVKAPLAVIAEVKKASPSKGVIRGDFDPVQIAQTYEEAGAACLSVLTDEPYFQGCDAYLQAVKGVSALPVLRKDFMVDSYQIYESRALGADCVLLIVAALDDSALREMYDLARDLGMDVLVEVHDKQELERAAALSPQMIGVNNRNLKTLEVDLQTSHDLAGNIPADVFKISESGIGTAEDISALQTDGYQGFLIGETLMKNGNIGETFKKLIDTK